MAARWMLCSGTSYEEWERAVEALPARKRKNWGATTVQASGVFGRVVYRPSALPSGAVSLFATRVPQHMARLGLPAGELVPYVTIEMEEREVRAAWERGEELLDVDGEPLVTITDDYAREERQRLAAERGPPQRRPRPHYVRVPTAPGQPIRG
jgi:hypothetical protein